MGDKVLLAVRPEKLTLSNEEIAGASIPGKIAETIYIGTDLRYEVMITDNLILSVREQNTHGDSGLRYKPGDEVFVWWQRDQASVLTN